MRMHLDASTPFTYSDNASGHALEQVSAFATIKPLASPGPVPSRRSSLIGVDMLASPNLAYAAVSPPDGVPPTPPPRRSSLSFGPDQIMTIESNLPISPKGNNSILSASITSTEASSGEFFSPTLSQQHPLSSATTSLSRSAKSSKEKEEEQNEAEIKQVASSLAALRLQRSLEWEARQARRRRRLDKRKMILLELIDTEVAYTEDLRLLVQVYLPQLAALPSITAKMASVIGRNAGDLLIVHSAISVEMVEILRQEGLGFRCVADDELEGKVERVSRRIAALLVENVSVESIVSDDRQQVYPLTTLSVPDRSPPPGWSAISACALTMMRSKSDVTSFVLPFRPSGCRICWTTLPMAQLWPTTNPAYTSKTTSSCLSSACAAIPCFSARSSGRPIRPRHRSIGQTTCSTTSQPRTSTMSASMWNGR